MIRRFLMTLVWTVLLVPGILQAQGFQRRDQVKSISAARGTAINNTLFPVLTGVATAYLFDNATVRTTGAALAVYGLVVGPSTGNFYANDYLRGGLGVISRLGSGYLLLNATRELMGERMSESLGWDNREVSLTDTKMLIGAGVFLSSMIFNVVTAKASVNEYNQSLGYMIGMRPELIHGEAVPLLTAKVCF